MKKLLLSFLITCMFIAVFSQQQKLPDAAKESLSSRGEVYFRFRANDQAEIKNSGKFISIDHFRKANWTYAYANAKGFAEFLQENLPYEILQSPSTLFIPKMKDVIDLKNVKSWDFYPTYDAYVNLMYQFQNDYPDLCKVTSIGQSTEGRELLVARISDNAAWEPGEAKVLYTSSIHGDETTGYILMLHLIEYLLSQYGQNQKVTELVNNMEIWINPLANPDGTYHSGDSTVFGATRYNANVIDLNRNYPDPEDGDHPDGNDWQPETQAFMQLAEENQFVFSANFHGGSEVFNYPWDTWPQLHADDDWWQFVGREWADTVQFYSPNGFFTDEDNGITNGYAWYTINGGRQDYMNYFHHCREVTIELSTTKLLPESQLENYWGYFYRSLLNYLAQAIYGIDGVITDSQNNMPVSASIVIEGHDAENSWVVSNLEYGWFFRPIYPGFYDLTVFAPGYDSKIVEGVHSTAYEKVVENIELDYTGSGLHENYFSSAFSIKPNPGNGKFDIWYKSKDKINLTFKVYDNAGTLVREQVNSFGGGSDHVRLDLSDQNSGSYFLTISGSGRSAVKKIIIK